MPYLDGMSCVQLLGMVRQKASRPLGQYEAAVADYDEAIRLKPDLATAYNNRGVAKEKLEQYEAAVADCNEAIRRNHRPETDTARRFQLGPRSVQSAGGASRSLRIVLSALG